MFGIVFSFINPLMEEWFWRLFLEKMLGEKKNYIVHIAYTLFHFVGLC
jgi:hypothetical protein